MIESLDVHTAPDDRFGRQALLHARGQRQVFLNFLVTLFQLAVRGSQFLLDAFDVGNVGESDDRIAAAFRILHGPRADNDRQAATVLAGQNKFEPVLAFAEVTFALLVDEIGLVLGVDVVNIQADKFFPGAAAHLFEVGIREHNGLALVGNEHTFVQALENAFDLQQPIWLFDFHRHPLTRPARDAYLTRIDCTIKIDLARCCDIGFSKALPGCTFYEAKRGSGTYHQKAFRAEGRKERSASRCRRPKLQFAYRPDRRARPCSGWLFRCCEIPWPRWCAWLANTATSSASASSNSIESC